MLLAIIQLYPKSHTFEHSSIIFTRQEGVKLVISAISNDGWLPGFIPADSKISLHLSILNWSCCLEQKTENAFLQASAGPKHNTQISWLQKAVLI
jgi:hypothetical protein